MARTTVSEITQLDTDILRALTKRLALHRGQRFSLDREVAEARRYSTALGPAGVEIASVLRHASRHDPNRRGGTVHRYEELHRPGPFDPLAAACRIASAAAAAGDSYVVYEKDATWRVAVGALHQVTVDRDAVVTVTGDTTTRQDLRHYPMGQLARAIQNAPVEAGHAYGWVAFEFAYLSCHPGLRAKLLTGAAGEPLACLVVPRTEVQVTADRAVVRSVSATDLMHTADLLDGKPLPHQPPQPVMVDVDEHAAELYEKAVAKVVDQIRRGKLHKAIISRTVPVPYAVDLTATYEVGRRANTPARSVLLDLAGTHAAGYSPETVTEVAGGRVSTQPLAGTRARGDDQHNNAALRRELESNLKELGEHGMSIIAAREEMRNLCIPHTLVAVDLLDVVARGSVQHLATRLEGDLEIGTSAWDALSILFPAITASGIPKPAAYRLIHDLEPPRGLYAGAVVAADLTSGDLDAALVLRAAFTDRDGHATLRAGAGIVADSDPAREYLETCEKLGSVAPHLVPTTAQPLAEAV